MDNLHRKLKRIEIKSSPSSCNTGGIKKQEKTVPLGAMGHALSRVQQSLPFKGFNYLNNDKVESLDLICLQEYIAKGEIWDGETSNMEEDACNGGM